MSLRLPSQKRFAPSRPKLGVRPGGPSIGPAKPSSGFVETSLPAKAMSASSDTQQNDRDAADPEQGNAEAGPSSRPYTETREGDLRPIPIPSAQLLAARPSPSPAQQLTALPPVPESSTSGVAGSAIGRSGEQSVAARADGSQSPTTEHRPHPSASPRADSHSPLASRRQLPPPSPSASTRPSASPAAFARPLPRATVTRGPSASPAPRHVPRISASPAPSERHRSVSRQPSATPSARSGGRPALIAAAENRASPLNLPLTAKERRRAEKEKERRERGDSESQSGTPGPETVAPNGLPPTVRAASAVDPHSQSVPGSAFRPAPSTRKEKESSAAIAERLVQQIRDAGAPRASAVPDEDTSTPLFDPMPEDEEDLYGDTRLRYGSPDGQSARRENGEQEEGQGADGSDRDRPPRKRAASSGSSLRGRGSEGPVKTRRPVAQQRNRYRRLTVPKPVPGEEIGEGEEEEGEGAEAEAEADTAVAPAEQDGTAADADDDEELNELDISDDEDEGTQTPGTPSRKRKRKRLEKVRKRPRSPVFPAINLDLVKAGEYLGEEVDEETVRMGEIATKRSGEGKVSARAKELYTYLRETQQRNQTRLDAEFMDRYERRQVMRRQVRTLRNAKREERRAAVRHNGGDPDLEVSDDEEHSEGEFPLKPERLTPESSPEPGGTRRERSVMVNEDGIEEEVYVEPPEGANAREAGDEDADADGAGEGAEDIEEAVYDPTMATNDADMDENHEAEDFDPELAAMGFTSGGPSRYQEGDDYDPDAENGETFEELYQQMDDNRRAAIRRNDEREVIEEEQTGRMPNNRSYMKKVPNERWSKEETEFFYQVLGETGENYQLMSLYFPGRTQRQLKNKGKRENAANPDRVNEAIRARRPIDPEYLQKTVGYDPRGPTTAADELLEETRELPARWTKEDTERAQTAEVEAREAPEDGEGHVEETTYQEGGEKEGDQQEADGDRRDDGEEEEEAADDDDHDDRNDHD